MTDTSGPGTDAYWNQFRVPPPVVRPTEPAEDPVRRFKKWKMAGRPPLTVDDAIRCGTDVRTGDGEWDAEPCGNRSRYIVERSDEDESFGELGGGAEACEAHLEETACGMMDGDDGIRAVVTLRWSRDRDDEEAPVALDTSRLTDRQRHLIRRSLTHSANHTYLEDEAEYLGLIRLLRLEEESND